MTGLTSQHTKLQKVLSQAISLSHLQQKLVKPVDGLEEGLLLGPLLQLLARVAADGKAVHNPREQVDLVRLTSLLEDLLGPVALLGGEDAVGLGGRDGKGALEAPEFVLLDEGRVGDVADLDAVLKVPANVLYPMLVLQLISCQGAITNLGPEAVAHGTELGDAVLSLQRLDAVQHDGVNGLLCVRVLAVGPVLEPPHEVEPFRAVEGQRVAVEHVEQQRQVAIGGKLVGD